MTKMKVAETKEEARQQAIDWQRDFSSKKTYWSEIIDDLDYFTKLATKFNLTEEFKENGII